MHKKVGIIGKMHSGKTTFAKALGINEGFTRVAFADPVKDASAAMLNTFVDWFDGSNDSDPYTIDDMNQMKGHPSIRKFLQVVGTEIGRNWTGNDSFWIDIFENTIRNYELSTEGDVLLVNDDCRFPNEAQRLRNMGFVLIKLQRDEKERLLSIFDAVQRDNPDLTDEQIEDKMEEMLNHPSETNVDLIEPDLFIHSVTVRQLRQVANEIATMSFEDFYNLQVSRNNQIAELFSNKDSVYGTRVSA
jgi:hypothetical protein